MKPIQRKLRRKRRRNNKRGRSDVAPFFIKNMLLRKTKYWEMILKLQSLKGDEVVTNAIQENLKHIVDLNQQQLQKGEYTNGEKLPNYSPTSVSVYGKKAGAMTLKDTGDYYNSMEAKLSADKELILLESDPIKFDKGNETNIEEKYGTDYGQEIKGLNQDNLSIVQGNVKDDIITGLRRVLFKSK